MTTPGPPSDLSLQPDDPPSAILSRRAISLTLAALAAGLAIHYRDGEYMFPANNWLFVPLRYIALAIVALALAIAPRVPPLDRLLARARAGELALTVLLAAIV